MIGRLLKRLFGGDDLTCEEVMEVLQAYLDGEVDLETAQRVATHLDRCEACTTESDVYDRIKASLASQRRPIDPDVRSQLEQFTRNLPLANND